MTKNEWEDGKAIKKLKAMYQKTRDSDHLSKASKSTASGCYAEVGYGCGAGRQNSSFNAAPPGSKRDGIAFPYLRNPELSSEVEDSLSLSLSCVTTLMEKYWPDLNMNLTPTSFAASNGLCFPRPPTQGVLKGQPTMNAHQIALRLCGWCQPGGACGAITDPADLDVEFPSGTRQEKESLKRLKKSRFGGSGLHIDWLDPDSQMGALTLYVCFIEESRHSNTSARSGGLEDCDHRDNERGFYLPGLSPRIKTFAWLCVPRDLERERERSRGHENCLLPYLPQACKSNRG